MKANESHILRFIGGTDKKFIIPVYQRPYSWKKENCVQLMKDLKDVYMYDYESHFFGSIVFVSQNNGVCEEHTIIDGQQRITTVSLLLLALRDYVANNPELGIKVNPNKITNAYLTDEYSNNEKKLKLKLVQGDDEAYDNLIENKHPIENTSITANYNYFLTEIGKMSPKEIEGLDNAISKLVIVSISLQPENGDDPQLIFESLNSTGLDLEAADKIRNFVLMRMKAAEQERFYRKYWEPLESIVTRTEMNRFIRYYLAVKMRKLSDEKKLYFEFKYYQELSKKSIETILQEMLEFARYYNIIRNPDNVRKPYSQTLKRINILEVKTCVPLIMDLFKANTDGYVSDDEMSRCFDIIENYIVRREICDLPTNALNKVFVQMGADIDKDIEDDGLSYYDAFRYEILRRSGKSRYPNDHDFEDKFMVYDIYNAKASIKKYILERLENYKNREEVAVERLVNDGVLTIEHIMPQTLTDDWKKALGSQWELVHSKYKDTPGNITLTAYNSDYSNSPFKVKKQMPEKGFIFSKLSLNEYVKSCEKWTQKEICERASQLFKKAVAIWWMPEMPVSTIDDNGDWSDWDEDFEITNKTITQITFMDSVINTADVTAAFKVIHEQLYDMDPTLYHNSDYPWFSEDASKFRKPYKIGDNGYVETNRSSQEKMSTIRIVAAKCGLDSHDIRFLIQEKQVKAKFDIKNPNTYEAISIGKLAYEFFAHLIEIGALTAEEVEKFKTKEYTKKLFDRTDYPIIADSRDANKGNSKHIRYRKNPLIFMGKEIYITTQWFKENRTDLIKWYNQHL